MAGLHMDGSVVFLVVHLEVVILLVGELHGGVDVRGSNALGVVLPLGVSAGSLSGVTFPLLLTSDGGSVCGDSVKEGP